MDDRPFILQQQTYVRLLPRRSLDFQSRMLAIFGERLQHEESTKPQILILSRLDDREADVVGLQLAAHGIPYLRINADSLLTETKFTFYRDFQNVKASIHSSGWSLHTLGVIWFRHFDVSAISFPQTDPITEYFVRAEWMTAIRSLMSISTVDWINHPDIIHKLDRMSQLQLADAVGLTTPKTLVSNEPEDIRSFITLCSGKAVVKVLGDHFLETTPGTLQGIFPRLIVESDADILKETLSVPSLYQEYIPHITEVRVTIIDQEVIAAEVEKANPEDIWHHPDKVFVQSHQLPLRVKERLQQYMKISGLRFGAFDLLLTSSNDYIFLEVNPIGDWLWLEARNKDINVTETVVACMVKLIDEKERAL